jgi:hypothetical protein
MSTSNEFANITPKKLLGYSDLGERMLDYLKAIVHESLERVWDSPAVHDAALTLEADGANAFKITGTSISADGQGRLLRISDAAVNDGISFENSNGVVYYVALKYVEIPNEIDVNPRTGLPEYRKWVEEIGEKSVPDAVTDNGNGTITFQVDGITESGVSNAGRQVMVYKLVADKNATTAIVAIETCTVIWTGSENSITTAGALGQNDISEVAADYNVVLLGPTVSRYTDLRSADGYVYVGYITGNAGTPSSFNTTDQQLATITLSQVSQIAAKASNGRLKVDITPLSGESGINQITSRGIDGEELFTVDERGVVNVNGIPKINTKQYPMSPSVAVTNTVMQTALEDVKAIASCTVDGKRKIFVIDKTSKVAELWDVETMTMDDSQDLTSLFYSSSMQPCSACGDGKYVYVWSNYTTSTYVNAIDVTDWSTKTGWPATGQSLGTTTSGPNVTYIGKMIENVDSDRLITARWINYNQLVLLSKENGSTISTGDGDAPSEDFEPRAICFDGKYVYALHIEGTPEAASYVISASVDNLNAGSGAPGWPKSVSSASDTYASWIATVDDYLIVPDSNSQHFWMLSKCGKTDFLFYSGVSSAPYYPNAACSDGVHMWLDGQYRQYQYDDDAKRALFRLNHHAVIAEDSGSSVRTLHAYSRYFEPFVVDSNISYTSNRYGDLMLFDGQDMFYAYKRSTYFAINRFPNVLFKRSSPPDHPNQDLILDTILGGAVNINCKYINHTIYVNQNITSFTISNYQRNHKVTVRLQASGSYTVDGFETSSYRRWPTTPRPSFSLTNDSHYLLELTCTAGATVYFEWKGPFTSL